MTIEKGINKDLELIQTKDAQQWFQQLVQKSEYVGELFSIDYENAKVQIHDNERRKVGGIPSLCFLIATRIDPDKDNIDFKEEDASLILLRVMDAAQLPNSAEAERIRVETAQRVSGDTDTHWDGDGIMDTKTKVYLGYAGVKCRIVGTFYLDELFGDRGNGHLHLKFGSDLSNFYPNRGLKVYKPNGNALKLIVNYTDPSNQQEHIERYGTAESVKLGYIRYASTNRKFQDIDDVPVHIYPADLLSQKSALFGMTRTGKSNTTKIIAKSVYELRYPNKSEDKALRIGQIIFDPNGEYANENAQDKDGNDNPNALKNIWEIRDSVNKANEVVTYGITKHPNDPDRVLMMLNFYTNENLQIGKEIIDGILADDSTIHMKNFQQVTFEAPEPEDHRALTRHNRRVLAYRAVLDRAGFDVPSDVRANTSRLFNANLINAMRNSQSENAPEYQSAAQVFSNQNPTWGQLANAFEALDKFIRDRQSGYQAFESAYVNRTNGSGDRWADENFKKIIGIFQYANGTRKIGKAAAQHSADTRDDYSEDIYNHLVDGKLIIIDQSSGEPELNKSSANRIMTKIFRENQKRFIQGTINIPEILVYIEEAHNILPAGSNLDLNDIWVRTAKEGAKYRIGMIYATQEVSSIQKNILRNTANWFISHLNNTDETKELCKYYDFADFEPSIRRAQDKGFLRIKTLSNPFVIPVQVDKFQVTV
ncbi:MAG: DUF87 domain-containing protein [Candidatus Aegiribacteria sp.]|nr:DUF87 domain-containing protein [Candidatus Aegiribacteria sp.]